MRAPASVPARLHRVPWLCAPGALRLPGAARARARAARTPRCSRLHPTAGLVAPEAARRRSSSPLERGRVVSPSGSRIELRRARAATPIAARRPARRAAAARRCSPQPAEPLGRGRLRGRLVGARRRRPHGRRPLRLRRRRQGRRGPDGVQALVAYGSRGGPGDQSADAEGAFAVIARWLGDRRRVVPASAAGILLALLCAQARRRRSPRTSLPERWRSLAPLTCAAAGAWRGQARVIAAATAGAGDGARRSTRCSTRRPARGAVDAARAARSLLTTRAARARRTARRARRRAGGAAARRCSSPRR